MKWFDTQSCVSYSGTTSSQSGGLFSEFSDNRQNEPARTNFETDSHAGAVLRKDRAANYRFEGTPNHPIATTFLSISAALEWFAELGGPEEPRARLFGFRISRQDVIVRADPW